VNNNSTPYTSIDGYDWFDQSFNCYSGCQSSNDPDRASSTAPQVQRSNRDQETAEHPSDIEQTISIEIETPLDNCLEDRFAIDTFNVRSPHYVPANSELSDSSESPVSREPSDGFDANTIDWFAHDFTDVSNARTYLATYGQGFLYAADTQTDYFWKSRRYVCNATTLARHAVCRMGDTMKSALNQTQPAITQREEWTKIRNGVRRLQHMAGIKGCIDAARIERAVNATTLDSHPYLLNLPNGTLDLQTGNLLSHQMDRRITKLAPTAFDHSATCPRFEAFIARVIP